jgi:DNA gyrase/topoisomerase IV subunit A
LNLFWNVEETQPTKYTRIKMTPEQAMLAIYAIRTDEQIPKSDWHKSLLPRTLQRLIDEIQLLETDFREKYKWEIREAYESDKRLTEKASSARLNAVQEELTQLDIEKLKVELEELKEWKSSNTHEKSALETQVTWLKTEVDKGNRALDELRRQLTTTEKPETTLTIMLTQPNIESLKKVVADMTSNTQMLKTTVETYLKGDMRGNVIAAMEKIMDYQTSCTWKDGWIWNAQTWESTMLVWKTIQEKMQSYHDLFKQMHKTKDEFEGVKLLRECKICVGDMLQYKKTCTNEKTWKDAARQVVGLQPTKMQMLKMLGEHGD